MHAAFCDFESTEDWAYDADNIAFMDSYMALEGLSSPDWPHRQEKKWPEAQSPGQEVHSAQSQGNSMEQSINVLHLLVKDFEPSHSWQQSQTHSSPAACAEHCLCCRCTSTCALAACTATCTTPGGHPRARRVRATLAKVQLCLCIKQ